MSSKSSGETELAALKKERKEDWEKVRKLTDSLERQQEPNDSKSLFEKLQEQKQKKELQYEEAHKLKNMIKGLDDDEIEFLDFVDRTKIAAERMKELDEAKELDYFRNRVSILQQITLEDVLHGKSSPSKSTSTTKYHVSQQQKLLKEAVVTKKRKIYKEESVKNESMDNKDKTEDEIDEKSIANVQILVPGSGLRCVGILPGMGCYIESSDEHSSDSEIEASPRKIDLIGREMKKIEKEL